MPQCGQLQTSSRMNQMAMEKARIPYMRRIPHHRDEGMSAGSWLPAPATAGRGNKGRRGPVGPVRLGVVGGKERKGEGGYEA